MKQPSDVQGVGVSHGRSGVQASYEHRPSASMVDKHSTRGFAVRNRAESGGYFSTKVIAKVHGTLLVAQLAFGHGTKIVN